MYVDSRTVEDGAIIETDICIVGAGAAGITMAMELSGGQARVAVIESGGLDYDDATQELMRGEVRPASRISSLPPACAISAEQRTPGAANACRFPQSTSRSARVFR